MLLRGLLVADFSRVLAGPYATMLLGDLGARVIKVEQPGVGDDTRSWTPPIGPDGQSTYFASINRNKESIALDLGDPADLAVARELAARADVMIENFRPGSLASFDLDYASVRQNNPGVIYCSISGFGSGNGAAMPGYDLLVQAMGGLMSMTGTTEPTKAGVAVVDVLTGLHAAVAILAALHHRDATGRGQSIEVSLLSALLSSLVNQSGGYVGAGVVPGLMGNSHPSIAPYDVFPAADRPMIIAVGNDGQFRHLATALGAPELGTDARFATNAARVAHRAELRAELERLLATADADHWQRVLTDAGVPSGPINTIDQAFALAERLDLGAIVDAGGSPQVANPVVYSEAPATYRLAPPTVGQDTERIKHELGAPR